ncbi:MAG: hypothetical protein IGS03_15150 [Candidatus Sericytochromatia bacterium]|nr:hypothetical protein [Candidatus Sericytochromatia bacterium]
MSENNAIVINLDSGKDAIVQQVTEILKRYSVYLKEGDISLSFILRKSGEKDRTFSYNFTQDGYSNTEKDVVFPVVVQEILRKEFPEKLASNQNLIQHVMGELKQDPYWSNNVVKLLDAIQTHSRA